jgi:serine phosphatase RsbU (regulator of sigma subunit)
MAPQRFMFFKLCLLLCALILEIPVSAQKNKKDIDSIETLLKGVRSPEEQLLDKAALSLLYFKSKDYTKAEELYQNNLTQATKAQNPKALGLIYHNRAIMFFYQYILDSSEAYNLKALPYRKAAKDFEGELKTTSNLASIYFMKSDFKQSLKLFNEGLALESKLNYPEGKYIDLNNMAVAYRYLKLYDKAIQLYRRAEKVNTNSAKKFYTIYSGLSVTFKEQNQADSSLAYAFRAKEYALLSGDSLDLAYAYSHIALVYNIQKKNREAISLLQTSLQMSRNLDDKRLEMACYGNIASNYLLMNLPDSADVFIGKMVELQNTLKIKLDGEDISKLLADYYYRKKDYQKSYDYFKIYSNYRDSVLNIEASSKLLEMQEKFDSEQKEKDNQMLQLENKSFKNSRNYLILILAISFLGIILLLVSYKKIVASRKLLREQKDLLTEQQKEILDSIQYARRIQYALLASDNLLKKHLPEHFVFFKPKAVVSGDFYWAIPTEAGFIYITGDCTGHGVPGAFMSLLFITTLRQTITEYNIQRPDLILNKVREEIVRSLNPEDSKDVSKDGMDAVVCLLDVANRKLVYAAANNSFYIIRNKALLTCKADKMPVGLGFEEQRPFTYNEIQLEKGDVVYTFTDGFADQFGGPAGKKYKYKQFEDLLLSIHQFDMAEQKTGIETAFEEWKGELEQVDDVCVIGTRI